MGNKDYFLNWDYSWHFNIVLTSASSHSILKQRILFNVFMHNLNNKITVNPGALNAQLRDGIEIPPLWLPVHFFLITFLLTGSNPCSSAGVSRLWSTAVRSGLCLLSIRIRDPGLQDGVPGEFSFVAWFPSCSGFWGILLFLPAQSHTALCLPPLLRSPL